MATWQDRFFELMPQNNFDKLVEVAKAAGISPSTLNTALKKENKTPKKDTMDKIASALNTTSKYLFYGDEEATKPSYTMPVLTRQTIADWMEKLIDIEQCPKTLVLPYPMNRGFCWIVDTPDMEPFIQRGDMVVCEPGFDMASWDYENPVVVLNAATSHQKKKSGQVVAELDGNYVTDYQRLSICELCIVVGEFSYLYRNPNYQHFLTEEPRTPIAVVRHIIRTL